MTPNSQRTINDGLEQFLQEHAANDDHGKQPPSLLSVGVHRSCHEEHDYHEEESDACVQ